MISIFIRRILINFSCLGLGIMNIMINNVMFTVIVPNIFSKKQRLDKVLVILFHQYSRSILKKFILDQRVFVNEVLCKKPNFQILCGDKISVNVVLNSFAEYNQPENICLNTIYEDDYILVINKQDNLVVHPGAGNKSGTLLNALIYKNNKFLDLPRSGIVHRLDKNTTGLMVIAKKISSYQKLVQDIKFRLVTREYQAIVCGKVSYGGTINKFIIRHPKKRTCMTVSNNGKEAITHYTVLKQFSFHTHLKIQLKTGRTHQIRVHMLHSNFPIVGDPIYKKKIIEYKNMPLQLLKTVNKFPRQALHASKLCLYHPKTNEFMEWTTPLPDDMLNLIKVLNLTNPL